jgi:hypothetical protein
MKMVRYDLNGRNIAMKQSPFIPVSFRPPVSFDCPPRKEFFQKYDPNGRLHRTDTECLHIPHYGGMFRSPPPRTRDIEVTLVTAVITLVLAFIFTKANF